MPRLTDTEIFDKKEAESSEKIRERVKRVWEIQKERYIKERIKFNGRLTPKLIKKYIPLTEEAERTLKNALKSLKLTLRSMDKIVKLSRTIADLEGDEKVNTSHLLEAISYQRYSLSDDI